MTSAAAAAFVAAMPGHRFHTRNRPGPEWRTRYLRHQRAVRALFRQNLAGYDSGVYYLFNSEEYFAFEDPTHLYAIPADLERFTVDSSGLTPIDETPFSGLGGASGSGNAYAGGLLYGANGAIVNPATTPPSLVATLPFFNFGQYPADGYAVLPDPSAQKVFIVQLSVADTGEPGLIRYDLNLLLARSLSGVSDTRRKHDRRDFDNASLPARTASRHWREIWQPRWASRR